MKKIINCKTAVKDGKFVISGDIVDTTAAEFAMPVQQTTVGYLNPTNVRWPRHLQLSSHGMFVKGGGNAFVIPADEIVSIAAVIEPKTSFSPIFGASPTPDKLVVDFSSELTPDLQWKWSDSPDPSSKWTDIAGATSNTLTKTDELKDKWVSCVASSEAGATATPPIKLV